jgi:hypothetical protein
LEKGKSKKSTKKYSSLASTPISLNATILIMDFLFSEKGNFLADALIDEVRG